MRNVFPENWYGRIKHLGKGGKIRELMILQSG